MGRIGGSDGPVLGVALGFALGVVVADGVTVTDGVALGVGVSAAAPLLFGNASAGSPSSAAVMKARKIGAESRPPYPELPRELVSGLPTQTTPVPQD